MGARSNTTGINNYPGSKGASGAYQKIISEIPRCDRFIEVMCGSATISSKIKGVANIVINDIDAYLMDKIKLFNVKKEKLSYEDLIDKYDCGGPKTVFYFDPPYLLETRSYQGQLYKFDWSKSDHKKFIAKALTVKSDCMISHYPCSTYDKAFKNWRKIYYNSMTRAGVRKECLYMNFKQPTLLLDYRYVGSDYTDRQRIKRKVEKMICRLNNLPGQERSTILSALIDHYNYLDTAKLQQMQKRLKTQTLF
jgi:DNA adenine methylase